MAMHYSDKNWKRFGEENPYYGVLTTDRFRKENLDAERLTEFFRSGEQLINQVTSEIQAVRGPGFQPRRCLEFGCGVGRLTIPLAKRFESVTAVDISEAVLQEAAANAERAGLKNIEFLPSDDQLSRATGEFDLVLTFITLQHIPAARGLGLIQRLLGLIRDGGMAVLHLTYRTVLPRWRSWLSLVRQVVPLAHGFANLLEGHRWSDPHMQMFNYNLNEVFRLLELAGCQLCRVTFTNHGGYFGALLFVRKSQETAAAWKTLGAIL